MAEKIRIALAGNPNVGKTTLFNTLTGTHQHVGNWPGKTVERKTGHFMHMDHDIEVVDLPGTYSLSAYSAEEIIARNHIVDDGPDVVVHVVDSCNLERNLYLCVQLIEVGANVILALNMSNTTQSHGIRIDEKKMSHFLGIPVVRIDARSNEGVNEVLSEVMNASHRAERPRPLIKYGAEIDGHSDELERMMASLKLPKKYRPKWVALKLLEDDIDVINKIMKIDGGKTIVDEAERMRKHLSDVFGENVDESVACARYGFIAGVLREAVVKKDMDRLSVSENIDKVVTHRVLGIPIFLLLVWGMFYLTFTLGAPFTELIEWIFVWLGRAAGDFLSGAGGPVWINTLVTDGILGGVGSVFVFIPNIFILFFAISLLEDSGYMARAAFIMDKVMHKIGLHGKSFIPMIIGFGCNVPAIMATRTLDNEKDRILTMLIAPFMSCSARLPVYVLFVSAFFAESQGTIIFMIYLLGIAVAIFSGLLFKNTILKGLSSPFVMELPPYRWPTLKGAFIHMWERGSLFVKKVGTVIFVIVIVIWFLASMPWGVEYASQESVIGQIGGFIAPVFEPAGFGSWQAGVALLFGFAAKEVIVGTFGTLYGADEAGLSSAISGSFTPLSAAAFIVMALLYVPCVSVVLTIWRETNSWKWPLFVVVYTTVVAWVLAVVVYQGGVLLGLG
ncbi:MAG: ferrous iron transport protein B [archaeon]